MSTHFLPSFMDLLATDGPRLAEEDGSRNSPQTIVNNALCRATQLLSVTDAPEFLLTAHHPGLGSNLEAWNNFMGRFFPTDADEVGQTSMYMQTFIGMLPAMAMRVQSDAGMMSSDKCWREAAVRAVGSLATWNFKHASKIFMPAVAKSLDPGQLAALSEYDHMLFVCAPDELADPELKREREALCGAPVVSARKKKKSAPKLTAFAQRRLEEKGLVGYTKADEHWEADLKAELAAKKAAQETNDKKGGKKGAKGAGTDKSKPMSAKEMVEQKVAEKLVEEANRRQELGVLAESFVRNGEVCSHRTLSCALACSTFETLTTADNYRADCICTNRC